MRPIRFFAVAAISLLLSLSSLAQPSSPLPIQECAQHLPYGIPRTKKKDTAVICRPGYALEHDNHAKIPIWVSYRLRPGQVLGCSARSPRFYPEPALLPGQRAELKDYAKSGYDIGHMASSADMRASEQFSIDSGVLSNAAPQRPAFNRGPWKQLEEQTRAWVISRNTELLVLVGPIYPSRGASTIGVNQVVVPTAFYKVLVDLRAREVLAFIYPAEVTQGSPGAFRTSLAEVQRQTGINFSLPKKGMNLAPLNLWPSELRSTRGIKEQACQVKQ